MICRVSWVAPVVFSTNVLFEVDHQVRGFLDRLATIQGGVPFENHCVL